MVSHYFCSGVIHANNLLHQRQVRKQIECQGEVERLLKPARTLPVSVIAAPFGGRYNQAASAKCLVESFGVARFRLLSGRL